MSLRTFELISKNFPTIDQPLVKYAWRRSILDYFIKKVTLAYISKHNFKGENQVILLMITDSKKWHYLAVKHLSALLRGITSNPNGDFYRLNRFHSYSTKEKLKKHEKVSNDHDYCYVEMANDNNKILKYNTGEKSLTVRFVIYANLECLLEEMGSLKIILENLIQRKKLSIHTSGYSLFTNCSFDAAKDKFDCYRDKDFMEKFCKDLKDHVMRIITYEEKEMIPLTDNENKSY